MAPGPEATTLLAFSSRALSLMTYTSHTRLGQGTPKHGSKHALRHPNTLRTERKALSTGATHRHRAKGAACEDGEEGGPQVSGLIGQDCLDIPTLGRKMPEDTQHSDLQPTLWGRKNTAVI